MARISEAFPSKYLKASDLAGKVIPVTIEKVETEQVGRERESRPVVYFVGKEKGVVLNKTNAKKIVDISGTDETDDWGGVQVALYATEVEFNGDTVEAIRIRPVSRGAVSRPAPVIAPPVDVPEDDIPF